MNAMRPLLIAAIGVLFSASIAAQDRGPFVFGDIGLVHLRGQGSGASLPSADTAIGTTFIVGAGYRWPRLYSLSGEWSRTSFDSDHTYGGVFRCCGTLHRHHSLNVLSGAVAVHPVRMVSISGGLLYARNVIDQENVYLDYVASATRHVDPVTTVSELRARKLGFLFGGDVLWPVHHRVNITPRVRVLRLNPTPDEYGGGFGGWMTQYSIGLMIH